MQTFIHKIMSVFQLSGWSLLDMLPYLLVGTILGEVLKITSWTKLIYKGVSKAPVLSNLIAAILGMASPLCTYGTVPVVLQLFKSGIRISPLVTFLSCSSLMNPQLFIMTWGGLGPEITIVRVFAVLIFGLLLGFIVDRLPIRWVANSSILNEVGTGEDILSRPSKEFNFKKFMTDTWKSLEFVGYYLVIGIVLGSIVEVFVPGRVIQAMFAPGKWYSVLLASIMGVPLFACGGGTIPFIRDLIDMGMSKGAAVAFFLVGPATRISPLMALATMLRPLFIAFYVLFVIVFSIIIGTIYH